MKLYIITSTGVNNWFAFRPMINKGVDRELIVEFISQLNSLGFSIGEDEADGYPQFEIATLNDEETFSKFIEYVKKLKEKLA